ncbi:MAG: hypothetical protein IPH45_05975 [Bacteroidales bacterium]|nr:hypothetical protein [Bacteroidales bacterium]
METESVIGKIRKFEAINFIHFIMKNQVILLILGLLLFTAQSLLAQKTYKYESVPGDPIGTRIYTLENGLKVYLSVYTESPRIQTAVAAHR